MRQVPLERDINIAVNGCSGLATSTQKELSTAMLILRSGDTYLILLSLQCVDEGGQGGTFFVPIASIACLRRPLGNCIVIERRPSATRCMSLNEEKAISITVEDCRPPTDG